MKRILYSCFIFLSLCLNHSLKAQNPYFQINQNPICYNASGVYNATVEIGLNVPNATNYIWTVYSPNCTASFVAIGSSSTAPWGAVTNTAIAITVPCCGLYTVTCVGQVNSSAIAVNQNSFTSGGFSTGVIYCPTGAAITPTLQTICIGNSATITASGASTYTWNTVPTTTGAVLVVSPTVNTCYTYTGTTASGCTITPSGPACVNVQAITSTVSPASQSMCAGSPVHFTATANVVSNASVTPGTVITGYQWFDPNANSIATTSTASAIATPVGGIYSVIITYTGAAGTCTMGGTSAVVITTSIPVSLLPATPSVCPGGALTMTAVSIQTLTSTNFTWTTWDGTGTPTVSAFHNNPHLISPISPPTTVTVNVDYFGCPGTATASIGILALTPTLTASAPLSCPGQSLSLTASGGLSYTFTQLPTNPAVTTIITTTTGVAGGSVSIATTPTAGYFPIQYCVNAYSAGCVGSACILVNTKILTPSLSASSASICPGTEFTLTPSGSGVSAGSSYTYSSSFNASIGNGNPQQVYTSPLTPPLAQTYSVTVDSAGCTGVASVTIYKLTLRTQLSSPTPSICPGRSLTLNATYGASTTYTFFASVPQFSNSVTSLSIDAGTSSTTPHQPPTSNTLITYTVIADSVGCRGIGTLTVGILDLGPTLTVTSKPSGSICPGSINTLTLFATGSTNYTFTAPGTGVFGTVTAINNKDTVNQSTTSPTIIPLAGIVYTISADSAGCVGSTTLILHEFKLNPTLIVTSTLVCSGTSVTLSAGNVHSNPTQPTTYTFIASGSPPVVLGLPNDSSAIHSPTIQTVYTVLVDSMGCTGVFPPPSKTVSIRPDIPLLPSTSAASVCPGLNATLSVVAPTTALSYSYTWSQVGSTVTLPSSNSSTLNVNPITNSTYSVHVLDSLGCVGNTIISVAIDPSISFSIGLASSGGTICAPQTVTITASNTIAANSLGVINYTWTPNLAITPTVGSVITASPNVSTIYTVTADNGFGCVAQNTVNVMVGTYPSTLNAIVPTAASVCVGFTSTLTAFGANSYTWTGPTFTNAIAQQSISAQPGAEYTVILSNGGGCTSVATFSVGQLPNLTPSITVSPSTQTTCITSNSPKFSKPVHLTASGGGTYVWFPYNPSYMTYSLGPQTDVRPPASTQYTLIASSSICSGTAVVSINVIPQFSLNVVSPGGSLAMCLGDSLKLNIVNIGSNAVGPVSAFTYSWTEALNAPPLSLSDYFTSTVTVYPQNTTTYTTEVRDSRECISLPRLVTVTVLPQPITAIAIPTINSIATNTVCFVGLNPGATDVTINLTGNNMNSGLQFGIVPTYTWISPYGVPYNSILSPANNNAVTVNAPIRLLNGSSVVVYTLISGYNGVQGCKRMDTVSVRVIDCRPIRQVKFQTAEPNDTICARSCITFMSLTDTMAGGPQKYLWKFDGGAPATSTLANPTVCYNFPNSGKAYAVILQVSNPYPLIDPNGGVGGSALTFGQNMIKVVDIPNVTVIAPGQVQSDTTVRFGQSVRLTGSGAHTYEWSPAYNITSLTNPSVTVNPFRTTQYILTGYNSKSCYSSDTVNVIIVEDCGEMYVPNAFTPNDDGANDVLYVRGICLQSLTFMVFNRFGEKVFETADQSVGWDGTYKGKELNTSVFVYRLEGKTYDGKGFSSKGNITLIR